MSHDSKIIRIHADDIRAAADWYSDVLATEPVSMRSESVEFRLDDGIHELEITRDVVPAGEITCWHVDDVDAAVERLVALGAREAGPRSRSRNSDRFVTVIDPFGNILDVA